MTDDEDAPALGFDSVPDVRPQSFAPAEMVTCDACLRANPPTRSNCLYCAAILPATRQAAAAHPAPELTGETEPGAEAAVQSTDFSRGFSGTNPTRVGTLNAFYIVLAPKQSCVVAESALTEVAALLRLSPREVESAVGLGRPVPVANAATPAQARKLADKLRALGVGADIFGEEELSLDLPAKRIRALDFSDHCLTVALTSGGEITVSWDDVILIVNGLVLSKRIEVEERRRRGRSQPLGSREMFADEPVVDFYSRSDEVGFRVASSSFDFSCLGAEKAMTAFENLTRLINLLQVRAKNVEFDDAYRNLKAVLANVWPLEAQTRKGEWRRSGAGKMDVATVTTIDNESQFNRYSRLRQQLKLRELKGDG